MGHEKVKMAQMNQVLTEVRHTLFFLKKKKKKGGLSPVPPACLRNSLFLAYREVSLGGEPLGEVIEGIGLGAHGVAVAMDLVEEVGRLVEAVVADVNVLLLHSLRPTCRDQTHRVRGHKITSTPVCQQQGCTPGPDPRSVSEFASDFESAIR